MTFFGEISGCFKISPLKGNSVVRSNCFLFKKALAKKVFFALKSSDELENILPVYALLSCMLK